MPDGGLPFQSRLHLHRLSRIEKESHVIRSQYLSIASVPVYMRQTYAFAAENGCVPPQRGEKILMVGNGLGQEDQALSGCVVLAKKSPGFPIQWHQVPPSGVDHRLTLEINARFCCD